MNLRTHMELLLEALQEPLNTAYFRRGGELWSGVPFAVDIETNTIYLEVTGDQAAEFGSRYQTDPTNVRTELDAVIRATFGELQGGASLQDIQQFLTSLPSPS